ncbi:hypothetical protein, partial [Salmonella enterica]|uniref:hypothetical protein n=1 Tax=Salmonella enterica TaxID=28901 RepID=UPI0035257572
IRIYMGCGTFRIGVNSNLIFINGFRIDTSVPDSDLLTSRKRGYVPINGVSYFVVVRNILISNVVITNKTVLVIFVDC